MEVLGLGEPKSPRGRGLETGCVCQLPHRPPTTTSWFSLFIRRTTELEITGCPPAPSSRQGHIWSPPLALPEGPVGQGDGGERGAEQIWESN